MCSSGIFQFDMFHIVSPPQPISRMTKWRILPRESRHDLAIFSQKFHGFLMILGPLLSVCRAKDHYALGTCEMPCLPASISTSLQRWKRSSLHAKPCETQNMVTHVTYAGPMSDMRISSYSFKVKSLLAQYTVECF